MRTAMPKTVLVIGWEYPPRIVGGLAVATYEIIKALSEFVAVQLIIPYKDQDTPVLPNVTVHGVNEIAQKEPSETTAVLAIHTPEELSAYPATHSYEIAMDAFYTRAKQQVTADEVYGANIWAKIRAFKAGVCSIAATLSFDIIHCHDWLTFTAGMRLQQLRDTPLVVHIHSLETDRVGVGVATAVYAIEQKAMQQADLVVAVSSYTKQCIKEHYQLPATKIVPVYHAIECKPQARWKHAIPQQFITFMGRITAQKGPRYLLETIQKVTQQYTDVRFVIAGSGDQLAALLMEAANTQLSQYIIYTGFMDRCQIDALLATTAIYFMPSVSEPFGLAVLEAANAGVPCVISKQSGVAEVLTTAWQADYWDTDRFAQQLITLLRDADLRASIVDKQQEEIKAVSWQLAANQLIAAYATILR